jgi:hypothetical protein
MVTAPHALFVGKNTVTGPAGALQPEAAALPRKLPRHDGWGEDIVYARRDETP